MAQTKRAVMLVPVSDGAGTSTSASSGGFAGVAETHSGVVFFVGDRAYKLKKAVQFGFLDFRSREAREAICHREVELNRRLAPDVYLGVADVVGPDHQPIDHLVVMRRLPEDRRLSTLVLAGGPLDDDLRELARTLAAFHARAATSPEIEAAASRDALAARWEANASQMDRFVGPVLDRDLNDRVISLARRYLAGRGPLIDGRARSGRARDGHGDLLAEDIFCLDDGPRVLDCLEFDDRLRCDDVLADLAFLAMDLEHLGRPELGERFLDAYREFAADTWPASLAHHHIAYRAQVRSKVACLRWEQGEHRSAEEAGALLAMAAEHLDGGRVRLVVVGGLPATGKSTLAAGIGEALGAVMIRSDETRKQLAGLDPSTPAAAPFGEGIYRPAMTDRTYNEMLDRARSLLAHGESVVIDASWSDQGRRDDARALAMETMTDLDEIRCDAPSEVIEARIAARLARGGDPSDATAEVARAMVAMQAPWPNATVVDTVAPAGEVLRATLGRLRQHDFRP